MSEHNTEAEPVLPKPDLSLVSEVHNTLMNRFGKYKKSDWEPNEENVVIMEDEEFDGFMIGEMENSDAPDQEKEQHAKNIIGYAKFTDGKLYMRKSLETTQEQKQTLAHEMLHLWFSRQALEEDNLYSYGVNETFVDTLALEGLNFFNMPKEERAQTIDGAINNAALIKGVIEALGEDGWKYLFEACQTGDQNHIKKLTSEKFGSQPPAKIEAIDENLPKIYNEGFWGRFKELALMIYYVRQDPEFQTRNADAAGYQQYLIIEWSTLDKKFLEELD